MSMNRRSFFRRLGVGVTVLVVKPTILAEIPIGGKNLFTNKFMVQISEEILLDSSVSFESIIIKHLQQGLADEIKKEMDMYEDEIINGVLL